MKRTWLILLTVAVLMVGGAIAAAAEEPAKAPAQTPTQAPAQSQTQAQPQVQPQAQAQTQTPTDDRSQDDQYVGGCCGAQAPAEPSVMMGRGPGRVDFQTGGWLIGALLGSDRTELALAFTKLDSDPDAEALLATPEAKMVRGMVTTGKLPDLSLSEFAKLSRSPRTLRVMHALYGLINVKQTLSI